MIHARPAGLVCFLVVVLWLDVVAAEYRNVYGEPLASCSRDGMALTGYTRNGKCVAHPGDKGSHHICIDLSSLAGTGSADGRDHNKNFCHVTGQPDWCSSTNMPCHENPQDQHCRIEHWCVCQWAFARYIEKAGGCDAIQNLVCESINRDALNAYQTDPRPSSQAAFQCLVRRCRLQEDDASSTPLDEPSPAPADPPRKDEL